MWGATRAGRIAVLLGLGAMLLAGRSASLVRAAPESCSGVEAWLDYLYQVREQQDALALREADLSRDPSLTPEELARALAMVADERAALNDEFQRHPTPPAAEATRTAYSLAWELDALIGDAYVRALRTGDERLRGLADGYTEASGTIHVRADQLLEQLLQMCGG